MAANNGAEQFSAFAALTGFDDVIRERERVTESRKEMSDDAVYELSEMLGRIKKGSVIKAVYYGTDTYETAEGMVADIDFIYHILKIGRKRIAFDDIINIDIK